jgi:hypothetical protein
MKKKMDKKGARKPGVLIIGIVLIISLEGLMIALADDNRASLQSELESLTSQLSDSGHAWLADYTTYLNTENDNLMLSFDNKILSNKNGN